MRLKTLPKITIQSMGCTARASTSVGSRSNFFSSIAAIAAVCSKNAGMAGGSTETASSASGLADIAVISFLLDRAPAEMNENVIEMSASGPTCVLRSTGVPTAATLPRCMMANESHSSSASSMACVVIKTVMRYFWRNSINRSQTVRRATGSSPTVGSSRNKTVGPMEHRLRDL